MDSNIKPSDLQGRDICFLLDIEYNGGLFRFSTFPIDIEDVNETLSAFSKIRSKLEDGTYRRIAEKANVS